MARTTPIELTNMIMIENPNTREILVQDRHNPNWPGVTFPGGHIEPGETVVNSAIREAKEETGLMIENPRLVGIKEWALDGDARYIVMLFKATKFRGEIHASTEGDIFWTTRESLKNMKTPHTFLEMLPVFDEEKISELALGDPEKGEQVITWL